MWVPLASITLSAGFLAGCSGAAAGAPVTVALTPQPTSASAAFPMPITDLASASTSPMVKSAGAGLLSSADLADFQRRFGSSAEVALVGLHGGPPDVVGDTRTPYSWSTAKVLVVATLLRQAHGPAGLDEQQRADVTAALSASDNDAVAELVDGLSGPDVNLDTALAAVTGTLRASGDTSTTATATDDYSIGETVWPLANQAEFLAAVTRGCVLDEASRDYLLAEMGGVIPEQRWGLGQAGALAFKGGWDIDDEDLAYVRQVGLMQAPDGNHCVAAISARVPQTSAPKAQSFDEAMAADQSELDDSEYQFADAKRRADEVATWVVQHVHTAPPATPC